MAKRKDDTAIQSHYPPEIYSVLKKVAGIKDWSDKRTVEKIVKLFLTEFQVTPHRIKDL